MGLISLLLSDVFMCLEVRVLLKIIISLSFKYILSVIEPEYLQNCLQKHSVLF